MEIQFHNSHASCAKSHRSYVTPQTKDYSHIKSRLKFFFGYRYSYGSGARGMPQLFNDVAVIPDEIDTTLRSMCTRLNGVTRAFFNQAVCNVYVRPGSSLGVHRDSELLFERPIFSLRLLSDSRLSFNNTGVGMQQSTWDCVGFDGHVVLLTFPQRETTFLFVYSGELFFAWRVWPPIIVSSTFTWDLCRIGWSCRVTYFSCSCVEPRYVQKRSASIIFRRAKYAKYARVEESGGDGSARIVIDEGKGKSEGSENSKGK